MSMERARRRAGEKLLEQGENIKRSTDWKLLPSNEDNKKQLTQMLRELWAIDSYAMKLQDRYKVF